MSARVISLGDLAAAGPGATINLSAEFELCEGGTIFVVGTFVATWKLEISFDGTSWVGARDPLGSEITTTTPRSWAVDTPAPFARLNLTAYTSGTVSGRLVPRQ